MEDYNFMQDLVQIRGVHSIQEKRPDRPQRHIDIEVKHGHISTEDMHQVFDILKNQKVVTWSLKYTVD